MVNRTVEDQSCTARPDTVLPVGLLTVPDTVTRWPGRAICGLIEVMATVTCFALAGLAGLAEAAPAATAGASTDSATMTPATASCLRRPRGVGH